MHATVRIECMHVYIVPIPSCCIVSSRSATRKHQRKRTYMNYIPRLISSFFPLAGGRTSVSQRADKHILMYDEDMHHVPVDKAADEWYVRPLQTLHRNVPTVIVVKVLQIDIQAIPSVVSAILSYLIYSSSDQHRRGKVAGLDRKRDYMHMQPI
jgi:hypothetical protein